VIVPRSHMQSAVIVTRSHTQSAVIVPRSRTQSTNATNVDTPRSCLGYGVFLGIQIVRS
jgi:hypothetical protein